MTFAQYFSQSFSQVGFHWHAARINLLVIMLIFLLEFWQLGWAQSSLRKIISGKKTALLDIQFFILRSFNLVRPLALMMFFVVFMLGQTIGEHLHWRFLQDWSGPFYLKAALVLFLSEFLDYWAHRLNHRIPALWEMHKVHHSATELSVFTDFRSHPGDQLADYLFRVFPLALIGLNPVELMALSFIRIFHSALQHSNLRGTWGWFGKYILLSPRAHHIHHSLNPVHYNKNFSFFFTCFDHFFGTWHEDQGEELKYGINSEQKEEVHLWRALWFPYWHFLRTAFLRNKDFINNKIK